MANPFMAPDPAQMVRDLRTSYMVLSAVVDRPRGARDKRPRPDIAQPAARPIDEAALPDTIRSLLADYRVSHPGLVVSWEKHLRTENGDVVMLIEDARELPDERDLISLSTTATLTTAESIRVITDLVVGRMVA